MILPEEMRLMYSGHKAYAREINRYNRNVISSAVTEQKLLGAITLKYHVLEKGFTMPTMRKGFGYDVIRTLIGLCNIYLDKNFDSGNVHFRHAVMLLNKYQSLHTEMDFAIDEAINNSISALNTRSTIAGTVEQLEYTKDDYFKDRFSGFQDFALSRHSVRNFTDQEVDIALIKKAVDLAKKSPSSCNRQPNRVYVISNKTEIEWVLAAQKGNRGFGDRINKLILLTGEISVFNGYAERNEAYVNSGLFAMGLLYGLHYYGLGAVPLAYIAVSDEDDDKIRSLCHIPDSEVATMFIGCGHLPDEFKVARSPRYDNDQIMSVI
jgi:nitroreductase